MSAVEGFTTGEVAQILDCSEEDVEKLIDQAHAEIAAHTSTKIMIIEDEPLIAMDIEQLVDDLGHTACGVARTESEALEMYQECKPGLILADIQLADGISGIDAVNKILKEDDLPVIFITAFPERLLTGERPEPTFLVTKPFDPDMVKALIGQALFFDERSSAAAAA